MFNLFSDIDKKAIAKVIIEIIYADNKTTSEECDYLEKVQEKLHISDVLLEQAQHMNTLESLSIIRNFSEEKKDLVLQILKDVIIADNQVDDKELDMLHLICDGANIKIPKDLFYN